MILVNMFFYWFYMLCCSVFWLSGSFVGDWFCVCVFSLGCIWFVCFVGILMCFGSIVGFYLYLVLFWFYEDSNFLFWLEN